MEKVKLLSSVKIYITFLKLLNAFAYDMESLRLCISVFLFMSLKLSERLVLV